MYLAFLAEELPAIGVKLFPFLVNAFLLQVLPKGIGREWDELGEQWWQLPLQEWGWQSLGRVFFCASKETVYTTGQGIFGLLSFLWRSHNSGLPCQPKRSMTSAFDTQALPTYCPSWGTSSDASPWFIWAYRTQSNGRKMFLQQYWGTYLFIVLILLCENSIQINNLLSAYLIYSTLLKCELLTILEPSPLLAAKMVQWGIDILERETDGI